MWIVTGIMSMIFCIIGWGMASKRNKIADWASVGSLSFVAVTLLMEYRMILNWVNKEDWSALMDVVPSMFSILCGYVAFGECRDNYEKQEISGLK